MRVGKSGKERWCCRCQQANRKSSAEKVLVSKPREIASVDPVRVN